MRYAGVLPAFRYLKIPTFESLKRKSTIVNNFK